MPDQSSADLVAAQISGELDRLSVSGMREIGCLMKQDGHRLDGDEFGIGVELDLLLGDHELWLLHDLPIHAHPAALDIELGLTARAGQGCGKVFREAYRKGHERLDSVKSGGHCKR